MNPATSIRGNTKQKIEMAGNLINRNAGFAGAGGRAISTHGTESGTHVVFASTGFERGQNGRFHDQIDYRM
jgi:hypothetical protein